MGEIMNGLATKTEIDCPSTHSVDTYKVYLVTSSYRESTRHFFSLKSRQGLELANALVTSGQNLSFGVTNGTCHGRKVTVFVLVIQTLK